jgi:hypothetical protein
MRSGVWLWFSAGLAFSGCSGDYPLEPTACDDYCRATKDLQCDFYSPAGCVQQCEGDHKGDDACRAQLGAVITCFESTPGALEARCRFYSYGSGTELACSLELGALDQCSRALRDNDFGPR